MTRFKCPGIAPVKMPARTHIAAVSKIGGVETKTGNRRKHVSVSRVDREPSTATALTVTKKIARRDRLTEQTGVMKGKRNRSGTIVTVIVKGSVSPAPNIWATANCVHRPNCLLHAVRGVRRSIGNSVPQHGAISVDHRMRIGQIEPRRFRFGLLVGALDRFGSPSMRNIISNPKGLGALGWSIEGERLKRPAVRNPGRVNRLARRPGLAATVNCGRQDEQDDQT